MMSGVMAASGTTVQTSERNRMSPWSTARTVTPLSTSRMLRVSAAGSETS